MLLLSFFLYALAFVFSIAGFELLDELEDKGPGMRLLAISTMMVIFAAILLNQII